MTRNGSLNWGLMAFLFWAAFLLVLEPGNLARAAAIGRELSVSREFARIVCASLIGTAAMPVVLFLERRYPVLHFGHARNAIWLAGGLLALAGVMNLVSCFVAAWGFEQRWLPSGTAIRRQLAANWTLLAFALIGLVAIVRVVRASGGAQPASAMPPVQPPLEHVIVKSGQRSIRIDLAEVDWIEAQGNYVALHVGSRTHLHRQALKSFMAQLDDARFMRIHRSTVVAMDRVKGLSSDLQGEATLQLSTGHELRVSKVHRSQVRRRWAAVRAAPIRC